MECTQRLECTQELYSTQSERKSPEQIGFLGICGKKYAVNRGPNKIGRDPQTCSIVLNLNSISRQHAVINVLNQKEFMLMDLDSANKTKLAGKSLQPFIPHPLKDGDMVQFGDVFGVFRLLEDDNELPMTQAIDIPDTPVFPRHMSRVNNPVTTIPESPDVSDRDDSFIIPSQPKGNKFKSPSNKFIKQSSKTISIQPIGSNKIDNVYWNSSKKSVSLHLDDSSSSLNDSVRCEETIGNQSNAIDIHEMETQQPVANDSTDSIYTAATQVPEGCDMSIHNLDTQLPINEHLPLVRKINNQNEMQFDLYAANKENDVSIFNAETQFVHVEDHDMVIKTKIKENDCNIFNAETQMVTVDETEDVAIKSNNKDSIFNADTQLVAADSDKNVSNESNNNSKQKINKSIVSDDEILFDEIDSQPIVDEFYSQPLLPQETSPNKSADHEDNLELSQRVVEDHEKEDVKPMKRNARLNSDSSTDCEEFDQLPIQKVPAKPKEADVSEKLVEGQQKVGAKPLKRTARIESDGSTDCEEFDMLPTQKIPEKSKDDGDLTDCEEDKNECLVSVTRNYKPKFHYMPKENPDASFEEMATQVIPENKSCNQPSVNSDRKSVKDTSFEDMPTQVIPNDRDVDFEDLPTQVLNEDIPNPNLVEEEPSQLAYSEEVIFPFKIPMQTPKKFKRKDLTITPDTKSLKQKSAAVESPSNNTDDKYYAATQELFEDLCSQTELSPEIVRIASKKPNESERETSSKPDELAKKENNLPPKNKVSGNSSESDGEEHVNKYIKNLSSKQVRKVIGVDSPVETIKRVYSDPSDLEVTPKKVRPFKLMSTELPDSQEIKTSVTITCKSVTESSSDSEVENDSQDNTPILFRNRKKNKAVDAKKDLIKNFDAQTFPSRVITRLRKPTTKILESDKGIKKMNENILKSKLFPDQESDINKDILTENISRLKTKIEKKSHKENNVDPAKTDEVKKESKTSHKIKDVEIIDLDSPKKTSPKEKSVKSKNKSSDTIPKSESKTSHTKKTEETGKSSKSESSDDKSKTKSKEKRKEGRSKKESNTKSINITQTSESKASTSLKESTDSVTTLTTRTRRSRNRKEDIKKVENNPVSPERKLKRGRSKLADDENEPLSEVRRSTRQKDSRSKKNDQTNVSKSHEQSAVYNLSSESNVDSPKSLKRSAMNDVEVPSPKRTRSALSSSLRATPARAQRTHRVLFTAFPSEEVEVKLEKLGAVIVNDVPTCTVVLTRQIRRTFKLLCAVGLGRPIVGPDWVQACVDTNMIVDPWLYLVKDEENEKRFQFNLARTLNGKRNFLQGYNISCTPKVQPSPKEMKLIVECSGGTWLDKPPRWICVSCAADSALWPALKLRGATIVSSEFILGGVLRQKINIAGTGLC